MSHAAHLEINLSNLQKNWLHCNTISGNAAAAVKANAYGLGIERVAPSLWQAGCKEFFVAHLKEGIQLRSLLKDATIYILHGVETENISAYSANKLIPCLSTIEQIKLWHDTNKDNLFALMVETGMNRLGITEQQTVELAENASFKTMNCVLLMSHFAVADEPNHPLNQTQIKAFQQIRALFPNLKASLANSDGLAFKQAHYDLTRPGIALYDGIYPVVTLKAPILQTKQIKQGESVGYGATFTADKDTTIALLSIGYADGLMRAGQGAFVRVNAKKAPIIGRISMDLTAIDITGIPSKTGEYAVIFDEENRISAYAKQANTISYEILTRLGSRLQRHYI